MITPRTTRLRRVPSLQAFRTALVELVPVRDLAEARATAVLVPSRSAGDLLRRTLEAHHLQRPGDAIVLPDLLTRRDWYEALHRRSGSTTPMLTPFERDALMLAAAHEAITEGAVPPFDLRPALVAEIREFYDALRRRRQSVEDFERLVGPPLEDAAASDRGAERLLRQTRFLAATFRGYERRVDASGAVDEHLVRASVLERPPHSPYRRVVVAVGDERAEAAGLWPADFDLLTRIAGLELIDIVATERQLAAGLLDRLREQLPEIEETADESFASNRPVLLVPARDELWYTARDRENELADRVRLVRGLARASRTPAAMDRVGIVFQRPLPYVYLARGLFEAAKVPAEVRDALPLAAEPFAAALDVVFSFVSTGAGRSALVQLMRSPHFRFEAPDGSLANGPEASAALDAALADAGYSGDVARLRQLADEWAADDSPPSRSRPWSARAAARAAAAGAAAADALAPLFQQARATIQLAALRRFLDAALSPLPSDPTVADRERRARGAVLGIIDGLIDAHHRHGDPLWDPDELAVVVRRWIESETFAPPAAGRGVQLLDAAAARFAALDDLHLVGLIDGEWPPRERRNIFYASALLRELGWPAEPDRDAPARAGFLDLLESPSRHVSASTFALEDDVLVEASTLLGEIEGAGLATMVAPVPDVSVFPDEALMLRQVPAGLLSPPTSEWLAVRSARPPEDDARFHGLARGQPERPRSVSSVELYAHCPFKYFARHVLSLPEETGDDVEGLTPLERGRFLHEAFEAFFAAWEARRGGSVTPANLEDARALAAEVIEPRLASLPTADAAFERTRLFGSPAAAGLVDLVLRMEAERGERVVERRLEHRLDGVYTLRGPDGPREVAIRGIADRIDLLSDGTFRIIDYKSSRPVRPLQLAIYAACVRQRLAGYRGRDWQVSEAVYLTFRGDAPVVPLGRSPADLAAKIAEGEERFVEALDGIARGWFAPQPVRRSLCASCAFSTVCRKEYVTDEQPAAAI